VAGAIARRADTEFDKLTSTQQAVARRILLRLVQLGEGTEDTRRRARLGELSTDNEPGEVIGEVVQQFVAAKPLRCRDSAKTAKPVEPLQAPRHNPLCCVVCLWWKALPLVAIPSRTSAALCHGPCQALGVVCGRTPTAGLVAQPQRGPAAVEGTGVGKDSGCRGKNVWYYTLKLLSGI